jgi:hypothetical protein
MLYRMLLGAGRYSPDAILCKRDAVADRAASSIARGDGGER